jgi:hypothetical protein
MFFKSAILEIIADFYKNISNVYNSKDYCRFLYLIIWKIMTIYIFANCRRFCIKELQQFAFLQFSIKILKNNGSNLHLQIITILCKKNCTEIIKSQTCTDLWPKKFPDELIIVDQNFQLIDRLIILITRLL